MNNTTQSPDQLFGYEIEDSTGNKVGKVDNVWVDDATNALEFVGVKTGFIMGKTHIIPTADAQIQDGRIILPYSSDQIKNAPSFGGDEELSDQQEQDVYSYYGIDRSTAPSPSGLAGGENTTGYTTDTTTGDYTTDRTTGDYSGTTDRTGVTGAAVEGDYADRASMALSEEELQVGTRQVEAGRVRLRKVVRTERQEVPVELRTEHVEIERIDADGTQVPGDAFQDREIEIPVMREEAVVNKQAHVTGEVVLNKEVQTETRTIGEDVRREDVEVVDGEDIVNGEETLTSRRDINR